MRNRRLIAVLAAVLGIGLGAAPCPLQAQPPAPGAGVHSTADALAILPAFLRSQEALAVARRAKDPVVAERVIVRLFASFLDRRPAASELQEGRAFLARTGDLQSVVEAIVRSREYARRNQAGPHDDIRALYRGVLGRAPQPNEVKAWVARVPTDAQPDAQPSASPRATPAQPLQKGRMDASVGERLKTVMLPLIKAMNRPLPLQQVRVGIMDDSVINAANAGGGEFYVTRGLLEQATDEQLRAVMAHEVAHADLGHVAKLKQLGVGINLGAILLDQIVPGAGSTVAPIAGQLIANAYTRKEEYEADAHGVTILDRAGYDGRRMMADTLTWLQQTNGSSGGGFFATHPATGDRIEAVRQGR